MKIRRFLVCVAAMGAVIEGNAQLIAYDPISGYTSGNINNQGQGYGWTSGWTTGNSEFIAVSDSDLSYAGLTGAMGVLQVNPHTGGSALINRSFPAVSTGTLYFGALVQYQSTSNVIRMLRLEGDGTTGNSGYVFLGQYNSDPYSGETTHQFLNIRPYTGNPWPPNGQVGADTGLSVTTQVAYLVGKIQFNTSDALDSVWMWVNPASATDLQNSANFNASLLDVYDLGNFGQFGADINSGSGFYIDEVRISTSATDMFGAIPEPSAYAALAGLAGLGWALAKRSRR